MNELFSKERLIEIAERSIYGLIADDKEEAKIFFDETLELTEDEKEFFGIENLWD